MFWYFSDDVVHTDRIYHALLLELRLPFPTRAESDALMGKGEGEIGLIPLP